MAPVDEFGLLVRRTGCHAGVEKYRARPQRLVDWCDQCRSNKVVPSAEDQSGTAPRQSARVAYGYVRCLTCGYVRCLNGTRVLSRGAQMILTVG